jgi:integrase
MAEITTNQLRAKWTGKDRWLSDGGSRGAGRLVARLTRTGAHFLFQYFSSRGDKRLFPLGPFDAEGRAGLRLADARVRSAELAALYRRGTTDLHAHFEQQRLAAERALHAAQEEQENAQREEQEALDDAKRFSLRRFLTAYADHLKSAGKPSARDVANIFKNHVFNDAALSNRHACLVTTDEFVDLISKVVAAGHGRTAAKLRSYAHAAYALGIRAKTNPAAPPAIRAFGIKVNPLASIDALAQFNKAGDRNLTAAELASFMKRVQATPIDVRREALELCIYTGGQRPTQLLRLRRRDVDLDAGVITLYDLKGRRQQPRMHVVPLTRHAADILKRRMAGLTGNAPVFSTDGSSFMDRGTLTNFVTAISADMMKANEVHEPFTLRDIRRTLETLMASWGISSDTRKHVQSHGLGGVQQRHYDRYEYLREKRAALKLLATRLDRLVEPRRSSRQRRIRRAASVPALPNAISAEAIAS